MENNSSSTTAANLLARIRQDKENAAALKEFWESALSVPPPTQFELMAMVRQVRLECLVSGVEAYVAEVAKKERVTAEGKEPKHPVTTANAKNYVCATGRNIQEKDDPKDRPPTERRRRRSLVDGGAWDEASGAERQKAVASTIAEKKAGRKKQ
jgi:hypothetical protein